MNSTLIFKKAFSTVLLFLFLGSCISKNADRNPPAPEPAYEYAEEADLSLLPDMPPANRLAESSALQSSGLFRSAAAAPMRSVSEPMPPSAGQPLSREEYAHIDENRFTRTADESVSTFSIDVDTASYANVRRMINYDSLPQPDAVRIEELVNYFSYDYPQPDGGHPFSITTEYAESPWNPDRGLLHIGLQGEQVAWEETPSSNLVFLIDVSGSMMDENKLPLLQDSLGLMLDTLGERDLVSIVVYAGAAGLVLPPTPADRREEILGTIESLRAGGSTAGGAGIELAYATAAQNYMEGGNNRVILATDGDFNVGASSQGALVRLVEEKREQGVFLSILGLGMYNLQDSRMESLTNAGNGNYGYIDTLNEARKLLVHEMTSTLYTIAKDVKIQIEFNPNRVASYRLIGYENRLLANQDFDNDEVDAGEIGAGHSVTALYEIVPAQNGAEEPSSQTRYQTAEPTGHAESGELAWIKFRYKEPDGETSVLLEQPIMAEQSETPSENFRFSAAVASWGMLLRGSDHSGNATVDGLIDIARSSLGHDEYGYRAEFLTLLHRTRNMGLGED